MRVGGLEPAPFRCVGAVEDLHSLRAIVYVGHHIVALDGSGWGGKV